MKIRDHKLDVARAVLKSVSTLTFDIFDVIRKSLNSIFVPLTFRRPLEIVHLTFPFGEDPVLRFGLPLTGNASYQPLRRAKT